MVPKQYKNEKQMKLLIILSLLTSCSYLTERPSMREMQYKCVEDMVYMGVDALKAVVVCKEIYKYE